MQHAMNISIIMNNNLLSHLWDYFFVRVQETQHPPKVGTGNSFSSHRSRTGQVTAEQRGGGKAVGRIRTVCSPEFMHLCINYLAENYTPLQLSCSRSPTIITHSILLVAICICNARMLCLCYQSVGRRSM